MEKKTGSYFKQLTKAMDVFVALVAGLVLAAVLFVVEWKDLFARIIPTYATVLQTMFNGGVLMAIVCCFVALLISLKEKSVVKIDALLVALTGCSVGGAVLFGVYGNTLEMIVWIVSFVLCLCFFAARAKNYDASCDDGVFSTKRYFATIARKYNVWVLALLVAVLGVASIFVIEHTSLLSGLLKYGFIGAGVVAFLFVGAYTVFSKEAKVNFIDAVLVVLFLLGACGAFYFVEVLNLRIVAVWAAFMFSVALTILIRSVFCKANEEVEIKSKGLRNYYGALFEEYSVTLPVLLGMACGLFVTFITRWSPSIFDAFVSGRKTTFLAVGAIIIVAISLVLFVVGAVKGGYANKKVNVIDISFLLTLVAVFYGLGILFEEVSIPRIVMLAVPAFVAVVSIIIRAVRVDVVKQLEVIEEDPETIDVKIVVDGDNVEVYCDGAKIDCEVVRNKKKENVEKIEVVDTKVTNDDVKDDDDDEVVDTIDTTVSAEEKLIIAKHSFENKIKFASPKAKNYYSDLKNAIMEYKPKSRVSKKAEAFRKKGLFAKLSVSGKSIRLHLALDPKAYDESRYHQVDLGDKRAFKEVPFTMKIRSDLACKRALELIEELANQRGLKKNKKYERVDYAVGLDIDGAAILEKLGLLDKLSDHVTKQQAEALTDDVLNYIPTITLPKTLNEESENVYLDTALKYVTDTISADTLHEVHQIPSTVDIIRVKARTGLDKRITVVADEIDPVAAKLVLLTGGKVFKVIRK